MGLESREKAINSTHQAIIDDAFVFQCRDLVFPLKTFLVDLGLFGAYERPFIDIGMHLDIGVV